MGGRGPDSRCRPGLPPRGPRAPPHSHSAFRKPDDRTGRPVSLWGSFGLPQAIPGLAPTPARAPAPAPPPASQAIAHAHASARTDRCAQTGHLACWLVLGVDLCLGVGLLNHRLLLLLVPSRTSILFSIPAVPTPIPTQRGGEFPLLHSFSSICYGQTLQ